MLEAHRHEGGDRRDDGQDPVGRGAGRVGEPDREADEPVAEDAENEGLQRVVADLRRGGGERRGPDGTAPEGVLAGRDDEDRGPEGADEVPGVDDRPSSARPPRSRSRREAQAIAEQVVAGEELGPADDDEDQAEGEGEPREHADDPVGQHARGASRDGGGKGGAEGDEGAGKDREDEHRDEAHAGLADADLGGLAAISAGHQRVEARLGRRRAVMRSGPAAAAAARLGRASSAIRHDQKSPTTLPSASMSIFSPAGWLGSPGIVRMSPASG